MLLLLLLLLLLFPSHFTSLESESGGNVRWTTMNPPA